MWEYQQSPRRLPCAHSIMGRHNNDKNNNVFLIIVNNLVATYKSNHFLGSIKTIHYLCHQEINNSIT